MNDLEDIVLSTCEFCGNHYTPVHGKHTQQRFCKPACQQEALSIRRKQEAIKTEFNRLRNHFNWTVVKDPDPEGAMCPGAVLSDIEIKLGLDYLTPGTILFHKKRNEHYIIRNRKLEVMA